MTHILAVYSKDDILDYVHGRLNEETERSEIEQLVQSDPVAIKTVIEFEKGHIKDTNTVDLTQYRRVERLKELARSAGLLH